MPDPLLLKLRDPESEHSPELDYLASLVELEARRAWPALRRIDADPERPLPALEGDGPVLLVDAAPILLAAASLEAMREALGERDASEAVVVPRALAATGAPGIEEIYTLRGYEEAERRLLETSAAPGPTTARTDDPLLLPVALLTAAAYRRAAAGRTATELRAATARELGLAPGAIAAAGIYHRFIDYYGEVRRDVLAYVPAGTREVLEVGCGRGATGRVLREELGCRVTGVELNPAVAADAARHLDRVITGDVASVPLDGRYDLVLALELIEHLPRPEPVLRRLSALLAPGGRMILSIPNVGHHSIVSDLLAGRWDYLPIGLLCYTHYRFFTRRTLADWLRRAGIERFELVAQTTPIPAAVAELPVPDLDRESLATKGFYVLVDAPDDG